VGLLKLLIALAGVHFIRLLAYLSESLIKLLKVDFHSKIKKIKNGYSTVLHTATE